MKVRWMNIHISHPIQPVEAAAAEAHDRAAPRDRCHAAEIAVGERLGLGVGETRLAIVRAAWMPDCIATSATPGRSSKFIMSPTANTSG